MMDIRAYVSCVVRCDDEILLVQEAKEKYHGQWNLPGGKLEYRETTIAGAEREVLEETGLSVSVHDMLGVYYNVHDDHTSFRFVHLADTVSKDVFAGDNILASQWFSLEEINALDDSMIVSVEQFRAIMRDVARDISYPKQVVQCIRYSGEVA